MQTRSKDKVKYAEEGNVVVGLGRQALLIVSTCSSTRTGLETCNRRRATYNSRHWYRIEGTHATVGALPF